jgi:hypothetical protein
MKLDAIIITFFLFGIFKLVSIPTVNRSVPAIANGSPVISQALKLNENTCNRGHIAIEVISSNIAPIIVFHHAKSKTDSRITTAIMVNMSGTSIPATLEIDTEMVAKIARAVARVAKIRPVHNIPDCKYLRHIKPITIIVAIMTNIIIYGSIKGKCILLKKKRNIIPHIEVNTAIVAIISPVRCVLVTWPSSIDTIFTSINYSTTPT